MFGEKQQLVVEDFRALSELCQHPGFALFCDVVLADIDDLANTLASVDTDENELRKLNEWRALRALYGTLQNMPAWALDQLQALRDAGQTEDQYFMGQELTIEEATSVNRHYAPTSPTLKQFALKK